MDEPPSVKQAFVQERIIRLDHELQDHDLNIQAIQARIRAAYVELERASSSRAEVARVRYNLAAEFEPINKLPYELLSKILLLGNEKETEPEYRNEPWEIESRYCKGRSLKWPVVMSHVNRRFRAVALTTCELWKTIDVGCRAKAPFPYASMFAERAKNCLLDVNLDFCDPSDIDDHVDPKMISSTLGAIRPITRWRTFSLTADGCARLHWALLQCCNPAPELRRLNLIDGRARRPRDRLKWTSFIDPVNIFDGVAPRLSSVTLQGVHIPWQQPLFSCLTELELRFHANDVRPSKEEYLHILQASPGLRRLALIKSGPRMRSAQGTIDSASAAVPVQLRALEVLEIGALSSANLTYILSTLSAPSLKTISLNVWRHKVFRQALELVNETRYPALRELKLIKVDLRLYTVRFLQGLPSLEELELYGDDGVLAKLIESNRDPMREGPPLLPKLQCLRAIGKREQELLQFLLQRKHMGCGLRKMLISLPDEPDEDAQTAIRGLVTFGFIKGSYVDSEDDYTETGEDDDIQENWWL